MAAGELKKSASTEAKLPFFKNGKKVEFVSGRSVDNALALAAAQSSKAEKFSRPTFTRWKPQHRKAGDDFCQAALLYCEAGDRERGMSMLMKACESYKKKRNWFSAAKTIEQAITLAQEKGEMKSVAELAWRSAALFRKAGHPDSAAQVLERAGKAVEEQLPTSCQEMLEKAAETVETENRPIQAACYTHKLLKMSLSQNSMDGALEKSRKLVRLYQEAGQRNGTAKAVLGLVAILLKVGNLEEAENVASEYGHYYNRDQAIVIEDLINGVDDRKGEMIQSALNSPYMQALDPEFGPVFEALGKMAAEFDGDGVVDSKPETEPKRAPIYDASELELIDGDGDGDGDDDDDVNDVPSAVVANREVLKPEAEVSEPRSPTHRPLQKTVTLALPGQQDRDSQAQDRPKPRPLRKRFTVGVINVLPASSSAGIEIGGTAESPQDYRPSSLKSPSLYLDVTGIDPLNPSQLGMTSDQWREWKRNQSAAEDFEDFDSYSG